MSTLDELTKVFRSVFEDDSIELQREMTANDIEGWDSLSHVLLIFSIEEYFKIKFSQKELMTFKNVGHLLDSISGKIS